MSTTGLSDSSQVTQAPVSGGGGTTDSSPAKVSLSPSGAGQGAYQGFNIGGLPPMNAVDDSAIPALMRPRLETETVSGQGTVSTKGTGAPVKKPWWEKIRDWWRGVLAAFRK